MSDTPIAPPTRRRKLKILLATLVLLAVAYTAYRYTLRHLVDAKLDAIRRKSYPVTLAELDKWYPQPSTGENAADIYLAAFAQFAPEEKSDTNLPIVGFAKLPAGGELLPPEMQHEIEGYLTRNQAALDLLHAAAVKHACRYPLDPTDPDKSFKSRMDIFSGTRQATRLLELETVLASSKGDPQRTASAIADSIALARSLSDRLTLVPYLLEEACLGQTVSGLEQAVSRTPLTEQLLVNFENALLKIEDEDEFAHAIVGERCSATHRWEQVREGKVGLLDLFFTMGGNPSLAEAFVAVVYVSSGLADLDHLAYLDFLQGLIDTSTIAFPQRFERIDLLKHNAERLMLRPFTRVEADLFADVAKREARFLAKVRTAHTAIAVERFRVARGELPNKLSELVPTYLDALPADPYDGEPLRYKKLAKGYVVYSIGEDRKDNGGVETCDVTFTVER
jgi:hypothetical protein